MMLKIVLVGALFATAASVHADDEHLATLQVGAETYTNVTVTSVSATEIFFKHSRGIGNAKLKNLQPSLQKIFHFDPAKAEAQQAEQTKASAIYHEAARNTPTSRRQPVPESEPQPQPQSTAIPAAIRPPIKAKSFLNQPAPILQVEKWLTEQPDTTGKFVLLDFWATWCGPCRQSIPALNRMQERFKDRLVIIGLSDEQEVEVRRMQNPKIEYTIAIDPWHRTKSEVEVHAIPHTLLIDTNGIVRFEGHPGYLNERNLEMLLTRFAR